MPPTGCVSAGSARAVVQTFGREGLRFPAPVRSGERKGELIERAPQHAASIL